MIQLENAVKFYHMGSQEVQAIKDVSMSINKGDFVALRGVSGSGKSTLMNIMGCLDRLDAGRYLLDGEDISNFNENQLAEMRNKKIGFIHQNFNLLPRLTALENVSLPLFYSNVKRTERTERAEAALKRVGLSNRLSHNPYQLSGGEQQRVAIARALINEAPVILADEPTGNLDSKVSVEVMSILARLNDQGSTIVLVTHEQDVAEWAQYAVYLKDGRISQ